MNEEAEMLTGTITIRSFMKADGRVILEVERDPNLTTLEMIGMLHLASYDTMTGGSDE